MEFQDTWMLLDWVSGWGGGGDLKHGTLSTFVCPQHGGYVHFFVGGSDGFLEWQLYLEAPGLHLPPVRSSKVACHEVDGSTWFKGEL